MRYLRPLSAIVLILAAFSSAAAQEPAAKKNESRCVSCKANCEICGNHPVVCPSRCKEVGNPSVRRGVGCHGDWNYVRCDGKPIR